MRVALDTNVLAYAEGVNGAARKKSALAILEKLPPDETFVPLQALGELFTVLVRKAGRTPARARDAVLSWQDAFSSIETSAGVLASAMDLSAGHNLGIWDAIVLSAAAAAGCRYLLSEDLQDGFTWNGVTVVNPFVSSAMERVLGG
ncbi:MAG TPA: PIN domain-containing protein [Terriglobales bacterium]|jgi:predicted nucleic acid-binding protein|nr:PIN domain-containing protein [Terriglobales bacterium]